MIYEIRTYRIAPGSLAEVEKRFGEGYEYRKKYSELTAFLHTEIGPLNEIVHIWPYRDLAERARIRGEASKDPNWPPKISEFVRAMKSEILVPFSFLPDVRPGKVGPVFELRYYTLKPGTLPDTAKGWEAKVPERTKLSPLVLAAPVGLWGGSLQGAPASSPAPLVYSRSDIDRSSSACLNEGRGRLRSDQNGVPGHRRARAPRDPWRHSRPGSADRRRRREDLRRRRASGREDR